MTAGTVSTLTTVPRTLLQRRGVPIERQTTSRPADGSTAPVDVGRTVIRLEGQTFSTPVIFADAPAVLSVHSLDDALLGVDPVGQKLVPVEVMRL